MFLSKEKLLTDRQFINKLSSEIAKANRSYITDLLESLLPDSEKDADGYQRKYVFIQYLYESIADKIKSEQLIENSVADYLILHNYFVHAVYDALLKKINDEDGIIKIVDAVLNRLTTSEDGKEKVTEILDKTNHIIVEHKKKSSEPWVNIVGDVWDDNENKFKVALDWNDAFIAMLRKQGITAENESDVVEMWLKGLANQ